MNEGLKPVTQLVDSENLRNGGLEPLHEEPYYHLGVKGGFKGFLEKLIAARAAAKDTVQNGNLLIGQDNSKN